MEDLQQSTTAAWAVELGKLPPDVLAPADYPRVIRTLLGLASGESWGDIALNGLTRVEYVMMRHTNKDFDALAARVEKVSDRVRQLEREEEAHNRAVNGEEVPIVSMKGEVTGTYRKRSDKLMELLLRASDPKKYGPASRVSVQAGSRVVLNVSLGIPKREPRKVLEVQDVEEIEASDDGDDKDDGAAGGVADRSLQPGRLAALGPGAGEDRPA